MKKILITTCLIVYSFISMAQQENTTINSTANKKISFHSINQIGLLEGEAGTKFQLQTINGIGWNKWFTGLGTGLDYYNYRTIPLFLDVRRNFSDKRITPFIYADGGVNFPWVPIGEATGWYSSNFKSGWYYDIGVGYTIQTKNSGGFVISAGYSSKQFSEKREIPNSYPVMFGYSNSSTITKFDYQFQRLSIKAGWKF